MIDIAQMNRIAKSIFCAPLLMATFAVAMAQVPTPTPEQLQMLQSLPLDQRAALLEELGLGQQGVTSGIVPEFPELTRPADFGIAVEDEDDAPARIEGGETLVITFDAEALDDEGTETLQGRPELAKLAGTR
ncbi:MAG: hypothetical protein AAFY69_15345, partial [Pseudomonadota bacterium]